MVHLIGMSKLRLTVAAAIISVLATVIVFSVGTLNIALGQGLIQQPPSSSTLTPAQRAMCDPNNPNLKFVNTTESHICGLPKSPSPNSTATAQFPTPTTPSAPRPPTAP